MIKKLILQRSLGAVITLLLASMVIFALLRFAPGDPIELIYGQITGDIGANSEMLEMLKAEKRAEYGLDQPIPIQYVRWLCSMLTLDLGNSILTGRTVVSELGSRIPATLFLSIAALTLELLLGLLIGTISTIKAGRVSDGVIRLGCVFFASLPAFVLSLTLLYLFAVQYHVYEISSCFSLRRLWLPATVLGLVGAPQVIRMVRATMLAETGKSYVSASISCGLSRLHVMIRILRNASIPIITTLAMSFAHLVGGSVVVESIFNWPGIGNYAMNSILIHDYPAVQGYTMLTVMAVILINLAVDVLYLLVDPRVRAGERNTVQEIKEGATV